MLRQTIQLLRQNPFHSVIYILATGLSLAIVMVLALSFYIKLANIYPETARDRMLILRRASVVKPDDSMGRSRLSLEAARQLTDGLQAAEAVTIVYNHDIDFYVRRDDTGEQIPAVVKQTDCGFWRVFSFTFLEGAPFSDADMLSGLPVAVISETYARLLFGTAAVTGRTLSLNFKDYRICGVVRDASYLAGKSFARLWIPFTSNSSLERAWEENSFGNTLGSFSAYILSSSRAEMGKIQAEVHENARRIAASQGELRFSIEGPDPQWKDLLKVWSGMDDTEVFRSLMQYVLIAFLLLLVPALSLSGMADSQMGERIGELGIRRAFGARKSSLIKRLVGENLLLTLSGGLFGLLLSYVLFYSFRSWIIDISIGTGFADVLPEGVDIVLTPGMLINLPIFCITLTVCIVLNLMVALIPAWLLSRRPIVYTLNNK